MNLNFTFPKLDTYLEDLQLILNKTEFIINNLLQVKNKNYHNFVTPYSLAFEELEMFFFPLSHLNATKNSDELTTIYDQALEILSNWQTDLGQREDIYQSFLEIDISKLAPHQKKLVQKTIRSFKHQGIGKNDQDKKRIKEINSKLSSLSNNFSKNLLQATKGFKLEVTNPEDVKEFPLDELNRNKKEGTDHWEFSLLGPSYVSFMKYGSNPKLRKELYTAYVTRAPENEKIIENILQLRQELATILGYKNYTEVSLLNKMASSSGEVIKFLDNLATAALPIAKKEEAKLQAYIEENYQIDDLHPWDRSYYINKYRESILDFKAEDVKPYFEQSMVLQGMLDFLDQKFNLKFELDTSPVWDPKVKVYNVYRDGNYQAKIYFDLETREDKRGGAWMNNSQVGYQVPSSKISLLEIELKYLEKQKKSYLESGDFYKSVQLVSKENEIKSYIEYLRGHNDYKFPIAYITCNFTPSNPDTPSLLSHSEVETLFHEMGHALQHICSEVEDPIFSGINGIEWDAVEWCSQFLQLYVFEPSVLKRFAKHYQTGEVISDGLLDKIKKLNKFRAASATTRQVSFSLFDMLIHIQGNMTKEKVQKILNSIRKNLNQSFIPDDKFQCGFSHIFSGGYSAGYYSYKWAEVLSVDTFLNCRELNNENDFYKTVLSQGSLNTSLEMFQNYMNRKPDEKALIKYLLQE